MNGIGTLYESGQGVPRDLSQAREWYAKGAAAGNKDAAGNVERLRAMSKSITR